MQRLNSVTWSATMNTDAKLYVCIDVICVVLKLERKLPSIDDRGQCSPLTYDHMTCDLNIQSPGSCDHGTPPIHKQDIDVKRYIGDCRVELAGREDSGTDEVLQTARPPPTTHSVTRHQLYRCQTRRPVGRCAWRV